MEKTLQVLNRMQEQGIFGSYAVCGGIAALFYIEPVATFDLDVLIDLPQQDGLILSLAPVYEWLGTQGFAPENEQVVIHGIPVQFIPSYSDLTSEALENALVRKFGDTETRVVSPEHLAAIMLQVGRAKDRERLVRFTEEKILDREKLEAVLQRHGLSEAYRKFLEQYGG